jgi:hypothetical protein
MANSVSTKTKVTEESQKTDDVCKSLLQTNNVFLYVPNIIGESLKIFLINKNVYFRLYTCFSFDCFVLFYANASECYSYMLFNK